MSGKYWPDSFDYEDWIDLDEVFKRSLETWKWKKGLPFPRDWWSCACCGNKGFVCRQWRYHKRPQKGHRYYYRVDLSVKCTRCALLHLHGIVIPPEIDGYDPEELLHRGSVFRMQALKMLSGGPSE